MMLRQRLALAAATPKLIPMPVAHAPLDRSTRQLAVRPYFRPLENRRSHSSNPHRSQRRNRAPSGPRFRALALLGRLSWERVDALAMQASEKPAQDRTSEVCNDRRYSITSTFSNETYPVLLIIEAVDESASDEAFRNADRVFLNAQLLERSPEKFNNG